MGVRHAPFLVPSATKITLFQAIATAPSGAVVFVVMLVALGLPDEERALFERVLGRAGGRTAAC
jgi:hypothetical protein